MFLSAELTDVFLIKPAVGVDLAPLALPTASNVFLALISTFSVHSPSSFFF